MPSFEPTLGKIMEVMKDQQHIVFENQTQPYNLNIVGIRTRDRSADKFNDWLTVFYRFDDQWSYFAFPATTDPGLFYRQTPLEGTLGAAVLKPGQYRRAYKVGLHKRYKAFQQRAPMTVYRDANRDRHIDYGNVEETGVFAINIHRSHAEHGSIVVDKWSAGCQVIQDPIHFTFLMSLGSAAAALHGNAFTYTLLEEQAFG
jgi:hypothetical protein